MIFEKKSAVIILQWCILEISGTLLLYTDKEGVCKLVLIDVPLFYRDRIQNDSRESSPVLKVSGIATHSPKQCYCTPLLYGFQKYLFKLLIFVFSTNSSSPHAHFSPAFKTQPVAFRPTRLMLPGVYYPPPLSLHMNAHCPQQRMGCEGLKMVWNHLICRVMSIAIRIHAATSGKCNESHLQHLSDCNGSDAECFLFVALF